MSATLTRTSPDAPSPRLRSRAKRRGRVRRVVIGLTLGLVGVVVARVLLGDYTITAPDFVRIVTGADIPGASFIVMESKLPRAVAGVLSGGALAVAGTVFQTVLRNPLASPDVVGVGMGGSLAGVIALTVLGLSGLPMALFVMAGAVLTAALVLMAAGTDRSQSLVVVGVVVSALLLACLQYLFTRADVHQATDVLVWISGSLSVASWPEIAMLAVGLCVLLPLIAARRRDLDVLELGDGLARGLGASVHAARALLLLAVLLVGLATAVVGPVAFVALMSGPVARYLTGGRLSLTASALVGATVTVAADYAAAYLIGATNLPAGVVTGALGAPVLLWLLVIGERRTA